jgi:hypothetical protein
VTTSLVWVWHRSGGSLQQGMSCPRQQLEMVQRLYLQLVDGSPMVGLAWSVMVAIRTLPQVMI